MKKIQTLLMMFSLFFLFSFSSAATFTFEEGQYSTCYKNYGVDYDSYIADLENYDNLEPNYISPALPDFVVDDSILAEYPYTTFLIGLENSSRYKYIFALSDKPLVAISPDSAGFIIGGGTGITTNKTDATSYRIYYSSGSTWSLLQTSTGANHSINSGRSPVYFANYEMLHRDNGSVVIPGGIKPPVMENPLSDAEIKSILDIFLESVRNADLPEHYGRYVLTYNKITGKYSGFVYPNYVDLGIEYHDFDDEGNRYRCISSVGPYYNFLVYHENNDYIDNLLDSISLLFKEHYIYEFRSNSTNTSFKFLESYSLFGTNLVDADIPFLLSTEDEPIIYASHKIYSMFFIGNDLGVPNYVVDYNTSIDNQIFTDDSGVEFDNTLNEYTESTDVNVGVFDFIRLLFGFIFSLVSFLSRFFVFIVSFVMVPASTNILPSEFVTGIEWLHTFAFGDILLWDIFSILFLVLLSTFIVNLIRSH